MKIIRNSKIFLDTFYSLGITASIAANVASLQAGNIIVKLSQI
jgi:hypothetical protein